MDKKTLRPLVLEILKKTPQTHFHAIENDLRKLTESYERHDVLTLQEILWEMLVQGVLAPGKNSLNLNLPFVHLTDYGTQCLEDGRVLAHDRDGYIAALVKKVGGDLDELVLQSTRGALDAFQTGSWPASTILLARAAEYLFDQLAGVLLTVPSPTGTQALDSSDRFSRGQARAVIDALLHLNLTEDVYSAVEPQLNGLLALIQHSRNQDSSPRWPESSRDQVLGFLLLFPEQCAFVYHLMGLLEGQLASQA